MGTREQKMVEFLPGPLAGFLVLVAASVVLFFLGAGFENFWKSRGDMGEAVPYIVYDLIIARGCYVIIRNNPGSIWYIPLLCNALGIMAAFLEHNFWTSFLWMPYAGGWLLTAIVSVIAWFTGKKRKEV